MFLDENDDYGDVVMVSFKTNRRTYKNSDITYTDMNRSVQVQRMYHEPM